MSVPTFGALAVRTVEKPWGRSQLPAPFAAPFGKRIGEIWFEPTEAVFSLLVKYIFTSEKLSVQVHPDDAEAKALGEWDRGKEECWLVIDAEPGATLGIGFREPLGADAMRAAAGGQDLIMISESLGSGTTLEPIGDPPEYAFGGGDYAFIPELLVRFNSRPTQERI